MNKVKLGLMAVIAATVMLAGILPTLAITTSDLNMQVKVKDVVAPPNVSDFVATPGDRHATLTWTKPTDPDFAGVKIRRSEGYYPTSVSEGVAVYEGADASFVDVGLVNGTRYYYTAFSYDAAGNYSSGALATVTPAEPTVAKSIEQEGFVLPKVETPAGVVKKENIELSDFKFYLMLPEGPLEIGLNDLSELVVVKGATLVVTIRTDLFAKDVNVITITLGGSSYLLKRNDVEGRFEAAFVLPPVKGDYNATIVIVYKDGTVQTIQSKFVVDPYGYVYEKNFNIFGFSLGGEIRVANAEVTLYQKDGNSWKKWPADQYNQKNPVMTDATGEYAFLAPNGTYYMEVKRSGYKTTKSGEFTIKDKVVNKNILVQSWWKMVAGYAVLLLILGTLAYLIVRKRRR